MLRKPLTIFVLLAGLALTACGGGKGGPTPTATMSGEQLQTSAAETVVAQLTQTAQAMPSPTFTETPTPTTSPTITSTLGPTKTATVSFGGGSTCDLVGFVSDVTVPDGTAMTPGQTFTKTWKLRNDGTCTWDSDYDLVFSSGDRMSGPESQQLTTGTVAPGATIDVSVQLVAPTAGGTYRGNWKLRNGAGEVFGTPGNQPFWVEIKVGGATATPGTGTPSASATATGGPKPDLQVLDITFWVNGTQVSKPKAGQEVTVVVRIANNGQATAGNFSAYWYSGEKATYDCLLQFSEITKGSFKSRQCTYTYQNSYTSITTKVEADVFDDVVESNEDNNTDQMVITVE